MSRGSSSSLAPLPSFQQKKGCPATSHHRLVLAEVGAGFFLSLETSLLGAGRLEPGLHSNGFASCLFSSWWPFLPSSPTQEPFLMLSGWDGQETEAAPSSHAQFAVTQSPPLSLSGRTLAQTLTWGSHPLVTVYPGCHSEPCSSCQPPSRATLLLN